MIGLALILIIWCVFPGYFFIVRVSYRVILLLILLGLSVYPVLLIGWRSNRKYAQLGSIRNIAQRISYEVRLALIFLIIIFADELISFSEALFLNLHAVYILPILIFLWLISRLRETNRTPFDFSEGERELVSGFNIEYRRFFFAMIFMAEYGRIYFFCRITVIIFFSVSLFKLIGFILFLFFWIWVRSTFPRYRYDLLMNLNWKLILPLVLVFIFWVRVISVL